MSIEHTQHTVFVSYAREDHDWVSVAANLLNAGGATVFMDVRDTGYQGRWTDVLKMTLQPVERVLVFWSRHAAASGWVQQECRIALRNGKRVVLVPMDDTPLSSLLWESHAVTGLKGLLTQGATKVSPPPAESSSAFRYATLAGSAALAVLLALFFFISSFELSFAVSNPTSSSILQSPYFVWTLVAGISVLLASLAWFAVQHARKNRIKSEIRKRLGRHVPPKAVEETVNPTSYNGGLGKRVVDMVFDDHDR